MLQGAEGGSHTISHLSRHPRKLTVALVGFDHNGRPIVEPIRRLTFEPSGQLMSAEDAFGASGAVVVR